jgi:hypothetical protein
MDLFGGGFYRFILRITGLLALSPRSDKMFWRLTEVRSKIDPRRRYLSALLEVEHVPSTPDIYLSYSRNPILLSVSKPPMPHARRLT